MKVLITGREPESWLLSRSNVTSLERDVKVAGRMPDRLFISKARVWSKVRVAKDEGIDPVRMFPLRESPVRFVMHPCTPHMRGQI